MKYIDWTEIYNKSLFQWLKWIVGIIILCGIVFALLDYTFFHKLDYRLPLIDLKEIQND